MPSTILAILIVMHLCSHDQSSGHQQVCYVQVIETRVMLTQTFFPVRYRSGRVFKGLLPPLRHRCFAKCGILSYRDQSNVKGIGGVRYVMLLLPTLCRC